MLCPLFLKWYLCSHMMYGILCRASLIYVACTVVEIPPTYYVCFCVWLNPKNCYAMTRDPVRKIISFFWIFKKHFFFLNKKKCWEYRAMVTMVINFLYRKMYLLGAYLLALARTGHPMPPAITQHALNWRCIATLASNLCIYFYSTEQSGWPNEWSRFVTRKTVGKIL